jgi:hypothetical protein
MEQKPLGPDAILEEKGSILELARGIEPPTGGLQTSPEPLSSHHSTASEPIESPDPPLG